jgi:hypothetical protein
MQAEERLITASASLTVAGLLFPAWLWTLLNLTNITIAVSGLTLLPLAAVYFAGARWWPGEIRWPYRLALGALGCLLASVFGSMTLLDTQTQVAGMALLSAICVFQTVLWRQEAWAALAVGTSAFTSVLLLNNLDIGSTAHWHALGVMLTSVYCIGGTLLRHSSWRFVTRPALTIGGLAGGTTWLLSVADMMTVGIAPDHVMATLLLAALLALMSALWRTPLLGYGVAVLIACGVLVAASRDFFFGWRLSSGDISYLLCGLTVGFALLGQALRCKMTHYARPYEQIGFALLTAAPALVAFDPQRASVTWTVMALLYGWAAWRYRLPLLVAPAMLAMDAALLYGAAWLFPGGETQDASRLLLVAAWAQGMWSCLRRAAPDVRRIGYISTTLTGVGALSLALTGGLIDTTVMVVAFGLAALLGVLASVARYEAAAWAVFPLFGLGMVNAHEMLGVDLLWSLAWGVFEALGLCLLGWLMTSVPNTRNAPLVAAQNKRQRSALDIWRAPLSRGPLLIGLGLTCLLILAAPAIGDLPPLTFALATSGLLLATLAVRLRALGYIYSAGAALVAAGLCQIADWGFSELQWYVVPAGLYLLALAEGLRHFQGRYRLSQVIESGALMLLLGATTGQTLRSDGVIALGYNTLLCIEALLLIGYGTLCRLRVPFVGGGVFFVFGVLWLAVEPLQALNKWVLLGLLGLLLVSVYVLLERRQEQLVQTGRVWIARVSSWR